MNFYLKKINIKEEKAYNKSTQNLENKWKVIGGAIYGILHPSQGKWYGDGIGTVVGSCLEAVSKEIPLTVFSMSWVCLWDVSVH